MVGESEHPAIIISKIRKRIIFLPKFLEKDNIFLPPFLKFTFINERVG